MSASAWPYKHPWICAVVYYNQAAHSFRNEMLLLYGMIFLVGFPQDGREMDRDCDGDRDGDGDGLSTEETLDLCQRLLDAGVIVLMDDMGTILPLPMLRLLSSKA